MKKLATISSQIIFFIQILLVFLLIFEPRLEIPQILQALGRMHPLLLHLPIGLIILLGIFQLFRKEFNEEAFLKIQRLILVFTALSTSLSALMGLILAQENGYEAGSLLLHKWAGVSLSFITYALLYLSQQAKFQKTFFNLGLIAGLALVIIAGHLGANITHGSDFLLAPLQSKERQIDPSTPLYTAALEPILEAKCVQCHRPGKRKGDLDMSSLATLLTGGEHGAVFIASNPDSSLLVQRISLPLGHEEHMPPEGKKQLTEQEKSFIKHWIEAGADTEVALGSISSTDSLGILAWELIERKTTKEADYSFAAANPKTVEKLNTPFRTVSPVSINSPALHAQLFVRATYKASLLEDLLEVKEQLTQLNLTNLPIRDEDMSTIAQFSSLEKLILNGTDIKGEKLDELAKCSQLKSLALSSTAVGPGIEAELGKLESLEELFLWNTKLTAVEIDQLVTSFPQMNIHRGFVPDESELLKMSRPVLVNSNNILANEEKVELKTNFPGAEIRYTLDGTEPDSLQSSIYEMPFTVERFTNLKAKAYKAGWIASDPIEYTFFKQGVSIDSAQLLVPPNDQYKGNGAISLIDEKKGDPNSFRSGAWLGYRESIFEALLFLEENKPISNLTFSYLKNTGSYIMPPLYVEVWGGKDLSSLKKLKRVRLTQPTKDEANTVEGLNITFPKEQYQCFKVVAQPVKVLPSWHRGAGDKGWVFVDEIFLY